MSEGNEGTSKGGNKWCYVDIIVRSILMEYPSCNSAESVTFSHGEISYSLEIVMPMGRLAIA